MNILNRKARTVPTAEQRAERKLFQEQEARDFAAGEQDRLDAMVRRSIALEGA